MEKHEARDYGVDILRLISLINGNNTACSLQAKVYFRSTIMMYMTSGVWCLLAAQTQYPSRDGEILGRLL